MRPSSQPTTSDDDDPDWPICTYEGCDEPVSPKRIAIIGKVRCLKHGDAPKAFAVAPAFNKGGYQLITPSDIQHIGRK